MPKKEHDKLARQASKKGLKGDAAQNYIYGTMKNIDKARKAKRKRQGK